MTELIFNKNIANSILNDRSLCDELIITLNELIDEEFSKNDDQINFDLIDAYTDALNELYAGKGVTPVLLKLQSVEEFVKGITSNDKHKKIAKIFRITVAACAVIALFTTADKVTENVTGQSIATHVTEAVQEIFKEVIVKTNTTTTESTHSSVSTTEGISEESTTNETPEEETTNKQEEVTTQAPKNETTTATETTTVIVTPQNPNLSPVLRPTTPPTETTTETTTAEPFTRVDEEVTAAPIVIKLTGTYSDSFKRDYVVGETADFSGLTITATYDNGTTKNVSISQCSVSGFSTQTAGNKIVTVKYEGCSFSFLIRVKEA